jgi:PAS domain S-box-containing protein
VTEDPQLSHFRRLLQQLPAIVFTTDRDLRFTSGAGAGLLALGPASGSSLTGVSVQEYLRVVDPNDPVLVSYRRALEGKPVAFETEWQGRCHQTHVEPFRDAHGAIIGTLAVSYDITERKRAEETLRLLSEASVTLAESLDYDETLAKVARLAVHWLADWCLVVVIEGEMLRPVAGAHIDATKESLFRALPPSRLDSLGAFERVVRGERSLLLPEITDEMIAPGGQIPLSAGNAGLAVAELLRRLGLRSLMVVPLVARKQALGALLLARTSSDQRYTPADVRVAEDLGGRCAVAIDNAVLYRAAQAAIEARDEFLSIASHELRTPLTSVLLRLEVLLRSVVEGRAPNPSALVAALAVVVRQSKRLSDLIDQLLDVSHIQQSNLELELQLEDVDLAEVLRDVGSRFAGDLVRAGSTLSLAAPAPAIGHWDRARLEQVITNLLSNAVRFARGTPIHAGVEVSETSARLEVRDGGMGIRPADQTRIFERFERAASSRHFGGLGLGLYITRQIVRAHGGTIRVESTPGKGSAFIVELPRS